MTREPPPGQRPRMSLRDYFAARAMQALIDGEHVTRAIQDGKAEVVIKSIANVAYAMADAMFEARRK